MTPLEPVVGRYLTLELDGLAHRVYFEEAGRGIPLLCQHTAGAHGAQWRHLLAAEEVTRDFRVIAYDLPYHGKSLPPEGKTWWAEEYRLTKAFLMQVPLALARALELERPVYLGSSIGGHLALDLAANHPESFRAVIGLEAAASTPGGWDDIFNHPRVSNAFKASLMYGLTSPTAPERYRRETEWVYSQGAPPVFKGDLYYYSVDHQMTREQLGAIDTRRCRVHLLTGEYDFTTPLDMARDVAAAIPGAEWAPMTGLGHFPMCEDPERFLAVIRPVLEKIRAQG
ncbi:MAG TPA: alpha/beta hydrolase [Myxococcota bacterium]|nr:alpha/beta hydrolase [Myxococcota bacterium]